MIYGLPLKLIFSDYHYIHTCVSLFTVLLLQHNYINATLPNQSPISSSVEGGVEEGYFLCILAHILENMACKDTLPSKEYSSVQP